MGNGTLLYGSYIGLKELQHENIIQKIQWKAFNKIRFLKVFRLFLILPLVITPVVAGLTWRILYSPSFGLINYFLSLLSITIAFS